MTRKYRQRGYQDEARSDDRRQRTPARPRSEGPRGRGLGAPGRTVSKCARCGAPVAAEPAPEATCPGCGSPLHSCANCRYFDTAAPNECRAGVEERVARKSAANDCRLFELKVVQELGPEEPSADDAKSAFDALFDF